MSVFSRISRFSRLERPLACFPGRITSGPWGEEQWRGHASGHLNLENLEILENSSVLQNLFLGCVENLEFGQVQILEGERGG